MRSSSSDTLSHFIFALPIKIRGPIPISSMTITCRMLNAILGGAEFEVSCQSLFLVFPLSVKPLFAISTNRVTEIVVSVIIFLFISEKDADVSELRKYFFISGILLVEALSGINNKRVRRDKITGIVFIGGLRITDCYW